MKHLKTIGIILLAAVIIILAQRFFGHSKSSQLAPMMPGESIIVTDTVGKRPFATRIEAIGTAYANESVDITATVSERIGKILFENGAVVKTGDLLVQLDDAEERADLEEANVRLTEQQRTLDRVKTLREKKMVAQEELDTRQSAMETAAARLAAAQARLQDRAIAAPFAGVLGIRRVSPGAFVSPGTVITTLDDLEIIKAKFALPETVLADIKIGQAIEARSVAWSGEAFTGTVASIDSRVEPTTRAIAVEAHIANPGYRLRSGMLLTVTLISRPREVIAAPEKALLAYADKHYAFIVKPDHTVERHELRLGEREVGWVEIENGLNEGETIVVEGLMDLKDGARVRIAGTPPSGDVQTQSSSHIK
jgi:membrane fusion protein, multidrug efflux system